MFSLKEATTIVEKVLNKYDVAHGTDGISANIDAWMENKRSLLDLLRNDPDWREDACAIVWKQKVEVEPDPDLVFCAFDNLVSRANAKYQIRHLSEEGCIFPFAMMEYFHGQTVSQDDADYIERKKKEGWKALEVTPCKAGMKTTRYIRALLVKNGIDVEDSEIAKAFQKWADELMVKPIVCNFILSINPADYLTMSVGTNWASCHILNPDFAKTTHGNSYDGCYKAGTLSYMNDGTTAILYTVENLPEDLSLLPLERKQTRQCFYINQAAQTICQGRLYPYGGNDYRHNLYAGIVKKKFSKLWNHDGEWREASIRDYFCTANGALHYPDYFHSSYAGGITGCNAFTTGKGMDTEVEIGHAAYCLTCGDELDEESRINCSACDGDKHRCWNCEELHYEDEMYWCDDVDDYVCEDCVYTCHECGEHFGRSENVHEVRDRNGYPIDVCESCLDDYCFCESCEEYHWHGNVSEYDGVWLCNDCAVEETEACDNCGEVHLQRNMTCTDGIWRCETCQKEFEEDEDEQEGA